MKSKPRGPFSRRRGPLPGVAVLILKDHTVLLARRRFEPAKGKLDIVGGFIEPGESAEEAAAREVREETDLHVRLTGYLGASPDIYADQRRPTLNIGCTAEIVDGNPKPQDDVAELIWFSLDNLPAEEMAFAHQRELLERCRKGQAAKWDT